MEDFYIGGDVPDYLRGRSLRQSDPYAVLRIASRRFQILMADEMDRRFSCLGVRYSGGQFKQVVGRDFVDVDCDPPCQLQLGAFDTFSFEEPENLLHYGH